VPDSPVPQDDVRQQLARIIASTGFGRSEHLARFLRVTVESVLGGEAGKLKEWVIGVEAYGRGPDFDPRVDSIVRTEARRLRRKLSEYYATEGREDSIIIELPTGSYEPVFRLRSDGVPFEAPTEDPDTTAAGIEEEGAEDFLPETEAPPVPLRHAWRISGILRYSGAVLLICLGWFVYEKYFALKRDPVHRLALLPVACEPDGQECTALGRAFIHDIGANLEIPGVLDIIEPETLLQSASRTGSISQIGSQLKADHVFRAVLERSGTSWYLTAQMIRASDQVPVWIGGFDCSWSTIARDKSQILNYILVYVSANSSVNESKRASILKVRRVDQQKLYARAEDAFGTFNVLRERVYSDYAEQQLNQILRLDPDFNDARVLLARLNNERMWGTSERAALLGESRSLLEAAIKLEPKRADAHALLAAVYWDLGQRERAMELAWRALQLGPLDATARAEMGRIYAEAGFFESAIAETSKALALDPTNLRPLGIQIVCLSWLGRQNDASEALNKFRQWYHGSLADLFTADQQLRARDFDEAGRLIASGKQSATAENRPAFDIVDGLRAALTGNRTEATRVFEQYKNSPPRFWDHIILLGAQIGEAGSAVQLIQQNPLYFNYRYLIAERRLAPLRGDSRFQALLSASYATWQRELSRYGASLPVSPPPLPSPEEFLTHP
jgi:tetratricopeptide (TPR) repeat protein